MLVLFSFAACGKKEGPQGGRPTPRPPSSFFPRAPRASSSSTSTGPSTRPFADKAIKEDKNYQKYQDFIKETGIDPQKDIYFVAVGVAG